jgi:hypothetical protein
MTTAGVIGRVVIDILCSVVVFLFMREALTTGHVAWRDALWPIVCAWLVIWHSYELATRRRSAERR